MTLDPNFIACKAIQQFNKLPKKGKPNITREWTTIAAIVQEHKVLEGENIKSDFKVISLGTGTKCLGQNELSGLGDVVSDSHAEVVARRSFLLYLYEQIELCRVGRSDKSVFKFVVPTDQTVLKNMKLRDEVYFHMFVSHLPCGDAAIIDKVSVDNKDKVDTAATDTPYDYDEDSAPPTKKPRAEDNDTDHEHRTGAKLQVGPLQYEESQVTGRCRVKPGKGDPTLCMSCSDKLAKWQVLGLQGCLLSLFIVEPLRLKSITIGGNVPFSKVSLKRALFTRFSDLINNTLKGSSILQGYQCPEIYQSTENFMKLTEELSPTPASISWYFSNATLDPTETVQVLVGGRKQGATKKFFGKPSSMVEICRAKIFKRFKYLHPDLNTEENSTACKSYNEAKAMSEEYVECWSKLKQNVFVGWTDKPNELKLFI